MLNMNYRRNPPPRFVLHTGIIVLLVLLCLPQSGAGQFYFGRNKIQYEDFDWQVLNTPHFQLFYYPDERQLAQAAAYWAEEMFDELEIKFNYTLRRQVPLVIYANHIHFQQTNTIPYMLPEGVAGFFEFTKGRVVLPNNGNMAEFRDVVRHELVHVFMHARLNVLARDLGRWDSRTPPLWFTEGLADWWAGGWDSQAEMVIRDALLNDYFVPLDRLTLGGAGFLLYKEGQAFMRYLEERWGSEHVRLLLDHFYDYDTFTEVLELVLGQSWETIQREWIRHLKRSVAADLAHQQLPGEDARLLTQRGANVSPAWYTDAQGDSQLVYLTSRDGYTNIYRRPLHGGTEELVLRGEGTPETESLHFLQSGIAINAQGHMAFSAKQGEHDVLRIVDLESREELAELEHPRLLTIQSPSWSNDGSRLTFSAQDRGGQSDIYYWVAGSVQAIRITDDHYFDRDPVFGPQDEYIYFSSGRDRPAPDGGTNLFRLHLESGVVQQITAGLWHDRLPRWPTGSQPRLSFVSDRSGTPNIWEVRLDDFGGGDLPGLAPLTEYHTAVVDYLPMAGDSLLVNTFSDYSFQLHIAPKRSSGTPVSADAAETEQPWQTPALTGTTSAEPQPYKLQYGLDIAQTAVAYDPIFGMLGGLQLSLSDMLGNRYYHFLVANTAQTSSELASHINFAVTAVNLSHRVNYSVGMFRFANEYYDPYQGFYFEKTLGVRAALNLPVDFYRRFEISGSLWHSEKSFFYLDDPTQAWLVSNFFSYVQDNSLWYGLGPMAGRRLRVMVGQTYDFRRSGIHSNTALIDHRFYWRINRRVTFAQRTMGWYNDGQDIRRFYIGGSWGIRGYRINELFGRRYIMLNQELRFPFASSLALRGQSYVVGFAPIRGAFFFDFGNAWEQDFPGFIGSYGFGLRGLFMGALALRLDLGRKTDFHSVDSPRFVQFFFGWDY